MSDLARNNDDDDDSGINSVSSASVNSDNISNDSSQSDTAPLILDGDVDATPLRGGGLGGVVVVRESLCDVIARYTSGEATFERKLTELMQKGMFYISVCPMALHLAFGKYKARTRKSTTKATLSVAHVGTSLAILCLVVALSIGLMMQLRFSNKPPQFFDPDSNIQKMLDLAGNVTDTTSSSCLDCSAWSSPNGEGRGRGGGGKERGGEEGGREGREGRGGRGRGKDGWKGRVGRERRRGGGREGREEGEGYYTSMLPFAVPIVNPTSGSNTGGGGSSSSSSSPATSMPTPRPQTNPTHSTTPSVATPSTSTRPPDNTPSTRPTSSPSTSTPRVTTPSRGTIATPPNGNSDTTTKPMTQTTRASGTTPAPTDHISASRYSSNADVFVVFGIKGVERTYDPSHVLQESGDQVRGSLSSGDMVLASVEVLPVVDISCWSTVVG